MKNLAKGDVVEWLCDYYNHAGRLVKPKKDYWFRGVVVGPAPRKPDRVRVRLIHDPLYRHGGDQVVQPLYSEVTGLNRWWQV